MTWHGFCLVPKNKCCVAARDLHARIVPILGLWVLHSYSFIAYRYNFRYHLDENGIDNDSQRENDNHSHLGEMRTICK